MADGDTGSGAQGGGETDPSGAPGSTGTDGNAGAQGGSTGTGESGQSATPETVSKADFDALMNRMRAADARAGKAETDLRTLREKDMPEMEKLKTQAAEVTAERDKLREQNRGLLISNAFLTDNTFKWRNAATALKLLDQSKIDIDSEGRVTGMKDALTALSKSDDYLLEPQASSDGAGDNGKGNTPPGTPPANTGGTGSAQSTKAQLSERFGPLRGRLGSGSK